MIDINEFDAIRIGLASRMATLPAEGLWGGMTKKPHLSSATPLVVSTVMYQEPQGTMATSP